MAYYWFKAFHLIGVVVWFAGLFYLVRLFVYHAEAATQTEPAQAILKAQYEIMEKRLYNIITTPGMIVTVAMAIGLISLLLVVIVLLAVFKNQLPLDLTTWLIVALVVLMAVTIQLYAKKRRQDQEKLRQNTLQKEEVATM